MKQLPITHVTWYANYNKYTYLKKFLLKGTKRCFRGPIKLDLGVQKIGKASERMLAENTWVGGVSGLQFIGFKS